MSAWSLGAFMFAYWVRFVASDNELAALGLDRVPARGPDRSAVDQRPVCLARVVRPAAAVAWPAACTPLSRRVDRADHFADAVVLCRRSGLLATCGWLAVGSSPSPACCVAHARGPSVCRSSHRHLTRDAGADRRGQRARPGARRRAAEWYQVVGFVDNGSDLDEPTSRCSAPIAESRAVIHDYAVDEIIIALPASAARAGRAASGRPRVPPAGQVKFVTELGELLPERLEVQRLGGRSYIGFAPGSRGELAEARARHGCWSAWALIAISPRAGADRAGHQARLAAGRSSTASSAWARTAGASGC